MLLATQPNPRRLMIYRSEMNWTLPHLFVKLARQIAASRTKLKSTIMNYKYQTARLIVLLIVTIPWCSSSLYSQDGDFDRESLKIRDTIVLRSKAKLYGTVESEGIEDGRKIVVFKPKDGGVLKIDVAKMVYQGKIRKIDEIDRNYNQYIDTIKDDPASHWELYGWCGDQPQGRVRFKDQRQFHLERIAELDPNDSAAKRKLGYDFIKEQNRWVPEKLYQKTLGYEKRGTGWSPVLQREIDKGFDEVEALKGKRKSAFRIWKKELAKGRLNPTVLREELFKICDPLGVVIVFEAAREEPNALIRAEYVKAIGRVPTRVALNALCVFAVEEDVVGTRESALALLGQEHYNPGAAVAVLATYLSSKSNAYVNRAAFGIGELGDQSATLALAAALVTSHMVKPGGQSGRINAGVGSDGNVNGLNMGGDQKPVMKSFSNKEVVDALKKVSDQNFGFNSEQWKDWYIKTHTHHDIQVRR